MEEKKSEDVLNNFWQKVGFTTKENEMSVITVSSVQQCVACTKVRVLNDHFTWSHWQECHHIPLQERRFAEKVVCEHCQKLGAERRVASL